MTISKTKGKKESIVQVIMNHGKLSSTEVRNKMSEVTDMEKLSGVTKKKISEKTVRDNLRELVEVGRLIKGYVLDGSEFAYSEMEKVYYFTPDFEKKLCLVGRDWNDGLSVYLPD